jgi:hypothetical protein
MVVAFGGPRLLDALRPDWLPAGNVPKRPPSRNVVQLQGSQIILRHDCVLLMMGITDDLLEGIQAAVQAGYRTVQSVWLDVTGPHRTPVDEDTSQSRAYVRVRVAGRTETLIAISTTLYWSRANASGFAQPDRGWKILMGNRDLYYCNLVERANRSTRHLEDTFYLPEMIRDCKGRDWTVRCR